VTWPLPARRPAGEATGALSGLYPQPALGAPPVMGVAFWDEFLKEASATHFGDHEWERFDMGAAAALSSEVPTADGVVGVGRITTAAVTGEGAFGAYGVNQWFRAPTQGIVYVAKLRCVDTTDIEVYSGWVNNPSLRPEGAIVNSFLGFKGLRNGVNTNWLGVCRNDATETTLDLGVTADTTWRILALKRSAQGFDFFLLDHTERRHLFGFRDEDKIGTISTNIPTNTLTMAPLGVVPRANVAKRGEIDFAGWGGMTIR
jgi:hypothetical protein